jgi:rhodanese-related sulfurtransferase
VFPFEVPTVTVGDIPSGALLLDCREDYEWAAGHIVDAMHVPMNQVPQRVAYDPGPLEPGAPIVVVCRVGSRSAQVAAWLIQNGFDARNLEGGMLAWAAAGRPMSSADGTPPQVA